MSSPAHNLQQSTHSNLLAIRQVCLELNLSLNPNTGSGIIANLRNRLIGRETHAVSVPIMKLSANEHGWASHHLHSAIYEASLPNTTQGQSWILVDLNKRGIKRNKKLLRSSVMMGLLPVTQLTKSDTLMPVIREVFNCYRYLYKGAQIIYQDVNPSNIMYWDDGNEKYGVLIDFDFSLPLSRQRMGTRPYMAIDLLQPTSTQHLYRHDLESLFYVIVVLVTRYKKGKEIINIPLVQKWFQKAPMELRDAKLAFLRELSVQPTSAFKSLESFVFHTGLMFCNGYEAQANHMRSVRSAWLKHPKAASVNQAIPKFNDETLEGNVDFDKFQTLLDTITQA